jgi:hypothetical protein
LLIATLDKSTIEDPDPVQQVAARSLRRQVNSLVAIILVLLEVVLLSLVVVPCCSMWLPSPAKTSNCC